MNIKKKQIVNNKILIFSISVIFIFIFVAFLSNFGIIGKNWNIKIGNSYEKPSFNNFFGTDLFGRSILSKIIKGAEISMSIGFIVSFVSVILGTILGSFSGYLGKYVDTCIQWIYSSLSSIPSIMLLISIIIALGKGFLTVCFALIITNWLDTYRLIRAEVIRQKSEQYVLAAKAIGASRFRILFYHILPNIMNTIIIQFSLIFQKSIKSEIILSFLGMGVQNKMSWGVMISDSKLEIIKGVWWQLFYVTLVIFFLLLSINIITDFLRKNFNSKLR